MNVEELTPDEFTVSISDNESTKLDEIVSDVNSTRPEVVRRMLVKMYGKIKSRAVRTAEILGFES